MMNKRKPPKLCQEVAQEILMYFIVEEHEEVGSKLFVKLEAVSKLMVASAEFLEAFYLLIKQRTVAIQFSVKARKIDFARPDCRNPAKHFFIVLAANVGDFFVANAVRFAEDIACNTKEGMGEKNEIIFSERTKPIRNLCMWDHPSMALRLDTPRTVEVLDIVLEEGRGKQFDLSKIKVLDHVKISMNTCIDYFAYLLFPHFRVNCKKVLFKCFFQFDVAVFHDFMTHQIEVNRSNPQIETVMFEMYWYFLEDVIPVADYTNLKFILANVLVLFPNLQELQLVLNHDMNTRNPNHIVRFKKSLTMWLPLVASYRTMPYKLTVMLGYNHQDAMHPYECPASLKYFIWQQGFNEHEEFINTWVQTFGPNVKLLFRFHRTRGTCTFLLTMEGARKTQLMSELLLNTDELKYRGAIEKCKLFRKFGITWIPYKKFYTDYP